VISFMPRPLYPQGKSAWYTLHRRRGGLQSRSGHKKNSHPLPRLEPPIIQLLAQRYTTELSRQVRPKRTHMKNSCVSVRWRVSFPNYETYFDYTLFRESTFTGKFNFRFSPLNVTPALHIERLMNSVEMRPS
jgi:hypothetical protein